jgi:hypothetical protein
LLLDRCGIDMGDNGVGRATFLVRGRGDRHEAAVIPGDRLEQTEYWMTHVFPSLSAYWLD